VLTEIAKDVWTAEGPVVKFFIFDYPTRMAVVRLSNGDLWIWSPTGLDDALAAELTALGPVKHLVSPNALHHLYMGEWKERFPDARLYASPGLAKKRTDLHFDAELGDAPDPDWGDEIDQVVFRGSFFLEEVVFLHRASETALVCDLIQRFDPASLSGWRGAIMKLWGLVGPNGSTPLEWRASWLNRRAGRAARDKALAWNPSNLVIAHGVHPTENGRAALERGLRWLGPTG
jgi:hypothetical protein